MIEVEFAVAHGDHKPDSRAKLPVNEAAHLLRTGRARLVETKAATTAATTAATSQALPGTTPAEATADAKPKE